VLFESNRAVWRGSNGGAGVHVRGNVSVFVDGNSAGEWNFGSVFVHDRPGAIILCFDFGPGLCVDYGREVAVFVVLEFNAMSVWIISRLNLTISIKDKLILGPVTGEQTEETVTEHLRTPTHEPCRTARYAAPYRLRGVLRGNRVVISMLGC
jgi:hypothetical protein